MKNNRANIIMLSIFAFIMVFCIFAVDDPKTIFKAMITAKPLFLGLAVLCMVIYWLLEALVFQRISWGIGAKIKYKDCFQISMIGQLFNCITPFASGGQPMQAYRLSRRGVPLGQASCALLAKFIVYQLALTIYTLITLIFKAGFFMEHVTGLSSLIFIGFTANTLIMALIVGVGFFPKPTRKVLFGLTKFLHKIRIVKNLEKVQSRIDAETEQFYQDFATLKRNPIRFLMPSVYSAVQLTAFFSVPFFVCLSLSAVRLDYIHVISAAAFVLLISSFVPLPGGSGGAEGGFFIFFNMFFEQAGVLAVSIILWRLVTFYLPIAVGAFFLKTSKTEKEAGKAVES